VLEGELVEIATPATHTGALTESRLRAGSARAFGAAHVHAVTNRSAVPATSLHVYSPPLRTMDFYESPSGRELVRVGHDDGSSW
jgi:hypothetical protein